MITELFFYCVSCLGGADAPSHCIPPGENWDCAAAVAAHGPSWCCHNQWLHPPPHFCQGGAGGDCLSAARGRGFTLTSHQGECGRRLWIFMVWFSAQSSGTDIFSSCNALISYFQHGSCKKWIHENIQGSCPAGTLEVHFIPPISCLCYTCRCIRFTLLWITHSYIEIHRTMSCVCCVSAGRSCVFYSFIDNDVINQMQCFKIST